MVKTVYIDVLFVINFIINYLVLFATAKILALSFRRIRLLLAAALGALYAVFSFFPSFSFLFSAFGKLLSAFFIVLISFGRRRLISSLLTFLLSSLLFGGLLLALSFVAKDSFVEVQNGIYYIDISITLLLSSSLASYILLRLAFSRRGSVSSRSIVSVTVENCGKRATIPTLCDTGNSLRDPKSGSRVLVSDLETLQGVLPENSREILEKHAGYFPLALSSLPGFRLIPYKTVGSAFSLILAFAPERLYIENKLETGALCAISEAPVSDGSGYHAII